jgi:hypothetical protein
MEKNKYKLSILYALGHNSVTYISLYADHNINIAFDVQISTEDFIRVR